VIKDRDSRAIAGLSMAAPNLADGPEYVDKFGDALSAPEALPRSLTGNFCGGRKVHGATAFALDCLRHGRPFDRYQPQAPRVAGWQNIKHVDIETPGATPGWCGGAT